MNRVNSFLVLFILLVSFIAFSACTQEKPADTSPEDVTPVDTVSFSEKAASLKTVFSDNGIDLDILFSAKMLAGINENSLNTIKTGLNELKDSFTSQTLKDLADVYLALADEFNAKRVLAAQSKAVSDVEELSVSEQCNQLAEFDLLVEKTQARINSYSVVNQKMQNFVKNYASEASEIALDELIENRLVGKEIIFNGFAEIQASVSELKKACEEGIEEQPLSSGDKGFEEEETEEESGEE